jgi:hypothetical protein
MTKVQQVRKEFDEPFRDVVKGFAEMGYSRSFTAKVLEINLSYFRQLCTRFDLHQYFKPQSEMLLECKPKGKGWPKGKKRKRREKYSNNQLLYAVKKYPFYDEFILSAPMAASTVKRRFNVSWREITLMAKQIL